MQYWKEQISGGSGRVAWICRDEHGNEVGKIRDGPDPRHITGYDQAAVEAVLQRRWGKSIADLEAELQADLQRAADEQARREAADAVLRSLPPEGQSRPTTVAKAAERIEALEAVVRELVARLGVR